jgi:hypothetical protein
MPTIKGNVIVHPPSCGHKGPIRGEMDKKTGKWIGKCAQCGAPAKIDMEITSAEGTAQA